MESPHPNNYVVLTFVCVDAIPSNLVLSQPQSYNYGVALGGKCQTRNFLDIFKIIEHLMVIEQDLVTSDQGLSILELVLGDNGSNTSSTLDKLTQYCSQIGLDVQMQHIAAETLAKRLAPSQSHRIVYQSEQIQQKLNFTRQAVQVLGNDAKITEVDCFDNVVVIDAHSSRSRHDLSQQLYATMGGSGSIFVLPGGLHLRQPRPFVFLEDAVPSLHVLEELKHRGHLLVHLSETQNGERGLFDLDCTAADAEELVAAKLKELHLNLKQTIIIQSSSCNNLPAWIPSSALLVGNDGLKLNSLDAVLPLLCVMPSDRRISAPNSQISTMESILAQCPSNSSRLRALCVGSHCVWTNESDAPSTDSSNFVLTLVSQKSLHSVVSSAFEVLTAAAAVELHSCRTLSSSQSSSFPPTADAAILLPLTCVEYCVSFDAQLSSTELTDLRRKLKECADFSQADIVLQQNNLARIVRRLAVFDMDSTLVQQECIDEMAEVAGVGDEVKKITLRAMNGELDFEAALKARVNLLAGLHAEDLFKRIASDLDYTPGAAFMAAVLSKLGLSLAVVSGGFTSIISSVKDFLGLHHAHANELEIMEAKLTGKLVPGTPIIDSRAKLYHLKRLAESRGIHLEQTVAVGDGANDLLMIGAAGLGVAFVAKPHVQKQAQYHINQVDLTPLLYYMGISRNDAIQFLQE